MDKESYKRAVSGRTSIRKEAHLDIAEMVRLTPLTVDKVPGKAKLLAKS